MDELNTTVVETTEETKVEETKTEPSGQPLTNANETSNEELLKAIKELREENSKLREANTQLMTQGNVGKTTQTVTEAIYDLFKNS